jgi:hypothetical protein
LQIAGRDQKALHKAVHSPGGCVIAVGSDAGKPGGLDTCCPPRKARKPPGRAGNPNVFGRVSLLNIPNSNKGGTQKMLKRITTLILSTGMCLALAGPISLAFQDQSQSQDKMSGDKMESHDKMDSHDKMSKDKEKMSKDKMDKEEKMDKMDHQSN